MIDVKGKKVLVVGLGASGYAASELLARRGARVKITESSDTSEIIERLEKLNSYNLQYELGRHTEAFCKDAELVVTSPGIDPGSLPLSLAREKKIPIIGELELGFWFSGAAGFIAITGTNGKSTTTELIGRILSLSGVHTVVCGNIGNPLSGEVDSITKRSVVVVEVSSFQLETIEDFRPHIAVMLNVSEDHYQRHASYDSYKLEKFKIFKNQLPNDYAVFHSSFCAKPMLDRVKGKHLFFGARGKGSSMCEDGITVNLDGKPELVVRPNDINLKGAHNLDNVACSVLVSKLMGVENDHIRKGIIGFKGLEHRFEGIGKFKGIEFIDDSKATNIDATRRAIESVDKKLVLIAGGRDKGGDYSSILPVVKEKVKAMVLIGEARHKIKNVFLEAIPIYTARDMAEAVKTALGVTEEGEIIMLSPMCSSFDMFKDYKQRGEVFQREVRRNYE